MRWLRGKGGRAASKGKEKKKKKKGEEGKEGDQGICSPVHPCGPLWQNCARTPLPVSRNERLMKVWRAAGFEIREENTRPRKEEKEGEGEEKKGDNVKSSLPIEPPTARLLGRHSFQPLLRLWGGGERYGS